MIHKIIPVVLIKELEQTIPTLKALQSGGINIAEITFRTACAEAAIKLAVKNFPDMLIGAGTVITIEQCEKAINAGAKFIVSPGFNKEVGKICKENNLPYYPGCVTPTEIMSAIEEGFTILKFFPANIYGGLNALKALSAPFPQVKFIPTGGVDESNLAQFLAFDKNCAIGGSFMMKGSYEEITEKSRQAVKIAEESL